MTRKVVAPVVSQRIDALQSAHGIADPAGLRLDEQVRMCRHQREGATNEVVGVAHLADQLEVRGPVLAGQKDPLVPDAAGGQVIEARLEVARRTRQEPKLAPPGRPIARRRRNGTH